MKLSENKHKELLLNFILGVCLDRNNTSFIKVGNNTFNKFISYLESKERYEDIQWLLDNKKSIINNK